MSKRKYTLDETVFEVIDTEEKAYWLGFILADGNVYINPRRYQILLQVGLNINDIDHLRKLAKFLKTDLPVKINKTACILQIQSKKIVSDLKKLGIEERKSGKEKFIFLATDELQRHFVRGYWDGDGSVSFGATNKKYPDNKTPYASLTGTVSLLTDTDVFLNRVIGSKITSIHPNGSVFALGKKSTTAKNIICYLYKDSKIYLIRKFETALKIFNWESKRT